jgi:hypothetical protein
MYFVKRKHKFPDSTKYPLKYTKCVVQIFVKENIAVLNYCILAS